MNELACVNSQQAPIRRMRKLKLHLGASKRICNDNGLTIISITGLQQSGKSVYAMLIAYDVLGLNVDDVFNHMVFSMDDFSSKIKTAIETDNRMETLIFDDASIHMRASTYCISPKEVHEMSNLGDTLGIATKSVILTSPSADLIKAFRNYKHYKVVIRQGRHINERYADGYTIGSSPMGQKFCRHEFRDTFDVRLPFYGRYFEMRKRLSLSVLSSKENGGMDGSLASIVADFMKGKQGWKGTATDLLEQLRCMSNEIPKTPSSLMKKLNNTKDGLYNIGIKFQTKQAPGGKQRIVTFTNV